MLLWGLPTVAPAVEAPENEAAQEQVAAEAEAEAPAAEEEEASMSVADLLHWTNLLWMCLAAFLVFFMQAGFAMVEAGFTRKKNAANIMMKNLMDFSIGAIGFWAIGFGLMFGVGNAFFGSEGFFAGQGEGTPDDAWRMGFLIFQTVFAATAATIVSGAMAERTKYQGYLVYSVFITVLIYPIFGHWAWGSLLNGDEAAGWLEGLGFLDFAGSTVVHSVGAWAGLAGTIVLGARHGKYDPKGALRVIPGHSLPLAALGVFILWMGWFGFNPGSTTAVDGGSFATIAVTTNLSAAGGAIAAMVVSWTINKKADVGMAFNGALAGLVAITAGCDIATNHGAVIIGLIAGVLVVFSVLFFDKIRVDDPVGAVSVHGICGVWGTLACGIPVLMHSPGNILIQLVGVVACFAWTFPLALILFLAVKYTIGLRVSREDEIKGLDLTEHGAEAYAEPMI
jgi:Amt family ammonium transporter